MTVMAAEGAAGAGAAGAAGAADAGSATVASRAPSARSSSRGASAPRARPLPPPRPESRDRQERPSQRRQQRRRPRVPTKTVSRKNYQPIILAEFIAAVLLTAATPFATKKDQQGLSPYEGNDIVKLAALTVLYLILALISTGGQQAGRLSAWFGGLILLVVGMNEAGNIATDLNLGGYGDKKAAAGAKLGAAGDSLGNFVAKGEQVVSNLKPQP